MEIKTSAGFGIGLVTGVIIGGVIALLYAPQSGKKTRQLIKEKVAEYINEVEDTVKEETSEVLDKITEVVDTVKEETNEVVDSVKAAAAEAAVKSPKR